MPVTFRGAAATLPNETSITIPAETQVGDMIWLQVSHYLEDAGQDIPANSGFTSYGYQMADLGAYADHHRIMYRWATAEDPGRVIPITPFTYPGYGGAAMVVFGGVTSLLTGAGAEAGNVNTIPTGDITPNAEHWRVAFYSEMSNTSAVPTFTWPAGFTALASATGAGGYHRNLIAWDDTPEAANTTSNADATTNDIGSNSGYVIALASEPPIVDPTITPVTADFANFINEEFSLQVSVTDPDSASLTVEFQMAEDAAFTVGLVTQNVPVGGPASNSTAQWSPTVANNQTRYWRARVSDEQATSAWTEIRSFTTDYPVVRFFAGDLPVSNVFMGDDPAQAVYLGDDLVWTAPPAPGNFAGLIAMFEAVPEGWLVCDGTNDTPNLTNRFVVGAGLGYAMGAVGGEDAVTLAIGQIPSHNHGGSTTASGNHSHNTSNDSGYAHSHNVNAGNSNHTHSGQHSGGAQVMTNGNIITTVSQANTAGASVANASLGSNHPAAYSNSSGSHSHTADYAGSHSHSLTLGLTGSDGAHENRPPYYALLFAQAADAAVLPAGLIGMGGSVLAGWSACDGSAGTPDLRNRFVVGAGGAYAVGATGGADAVALSEATMPSHNHNANSNTESNHNHNVGSDGDHSHYSGNFSTHGNHTHTYTRPNSASPSMGGSGKTVYGPVANSYTSTETPPAHNLSFVSQSIGHSHNNSNASGSHSHTVSVGNSGSGTAHENRPPYHALNYLKAAADVEEAPAGLVLMTTTEPAEGWALCDGAEGRPDLRNRFVVGAGQAYVVGDLGGTDTVTLTLANLPSHSHNGNSSSDGSHAHATSYDSASHSHSGVSSSHDSHRHGTYTALNSSYSRGTGNWTGAHTSRSTTNLDSHTHTHNVGASSTDGTHAHSLGTQASHSHSVTVDPTGGDTGHENRPPYYALSFVIKL